MMPLAFASRSRISRHGDLLVETDWQADYFHQGLALAGLPEE